MTHYKNIQIKMLLPYVTEEGHLEVVGTTLKIYSSMLHIQFQYSVDLCPHFAQLS